MSVAPSERAVQVIGASCAEIDYALAKLAAVRGGAGGGGVTLWTWAPTVTLPPGRAGALLSSNSFPMTPPMGRPAHARQAPRRL